MTKAVKISYVISIKSFIRASYCLVLEADGFGTDQPFFKCIVAQKNGEGKISS